MKKYERKKTQIALPFVGFPVGFSYPAARKFFTTYNPFLCVRKITNGWSKEIL